jgi:two-component system response regulator AtoC
MSKGTILVVDDEESVRTMLKLVLCSEGYTVIEAGDGLAGVERICADCPDLVLMDVRMPRLDGMSAFLRVRGLWHGVFILMTAFAAVNDAVEAIKAGAYDYIIKPFNIEELKTMIACALGSRESGAPDAPKAEGRRLISPESCRSQAIQSVLFEADNAAPTNATILLLGESGTGKEVFADHIHYAGPRAGGPFIKVSCGALPESLLESELFGHEKGAFTNAVGRRLGRFERADKGTIFLDEIGEMPQSVQIKLLRVLQEREFERLGGSETIRTDTRVIAATNRSPEELVRSGALRRDLYYRRAVVVLELPPLRQRREDILPLTKLFLERFNRSHGKNVSAVTPEAAVILENYAWPGNIRELSNVVERAVIMTFGGKLRRESLPAHMAGTEDARSGLFAPVPPRDLRDILRATEKETLLATLARNQGNRSKTARELGLSRRALLYKIAEYGIKE